MMKVPLQEVQQNITKNNEDCRLYDGFSDSEVVDVEVPSNPPYPTVIAIFLSNLSIDTDGRDLRDLSMLLISSLFF